MDVSRDMIEEAADKWIVGRNAERNREIVKRRLIDGIRYEALADEFGLSVRHTKTIVYKYGDKVLSHL